MIRRLLMLAFIAAALTPGTWIRSPPKEPDFRDLLTVTPVETGVQTIGELDVLGLWELDSSNTHFGSYSALVAMDDGTLLAGSDRGRLLQFSPPGGAGENGEETIRFTAFAGASERDKDEVDLESLTRDPATGTIWAGYESSNAIARITPDFTEDARVRPDEMSGWSGNSGPESLVRLTDGRFLVIAEGNPSSDGSDIPALLYPDDPVKGETPLQFTFAAPENYRAVDAVQLPSGRMLVLVRKIDLGFPPGFASILVLLDPADIAEGEAWSGREVARFARPLPSDNFEGLAITSGAGRVGGSTTLWMISDDNNGVLQRTLLYALLLPPDM